MDLDNFNNFLSDMADLDTFKTFEDWMQCSLQKKRQRRPRFNPLKMLQKNQFRLKYRFSKDNMRRIIELLRDDLQLDTDPTRRNNHKNQVPFALQIMAAIRYWGRTEHPEVTAAVHGISRSTLAKICKRIAIGLSAKASRYIRMPSTLSEKERVINAFQNLAGMPQVIGAVCGTSVRFRRASSGATAAEESNHRQCLNSQLHIQIVSDASYKIRDLDCRLLRTLTRRSNYAHRMFTQTRIKERFEQNEFRGRILLADDRFACKPFLFTPIQLPLEAAEQAYNRSHSTTYAPVVHCLNALMQRFGILGSELCTASFGVARHTIVALALLHNMAIEWNDSILDSSLNGFSDTDSYGYSFGSPASENTDDTLARLEFIKQNF